MDEIQRNFGQSGSDSVRCLRGGISVQLTAGEPDLLQCSECAAGCGNLFYVAADGAKSPEPLPLQKIQPPVEILPSLFGHEKYVMWQ